MSRGLLTPKNDAMIDWVCPVNWLAPLNRGLVAWYLTIPGSMGGRQWADLCCRHPGTLTAMDPPTDWSGVTHPGGWGSLNFDGTGDRCVTGFNPEGLLPEDSDVYLYTMSCWFKRASGAGTAILWSWSPTGGILGGMVFVPGSNVITVTDAGQDGPNGNVSLSWVEDEEWHHLIYSPQARTIAPQMWLDGNPLTVTTDSGSVSATAGDNLIIGGRGAGPAGWNGYLDDFRVSKGSIATDDQARAIYRASRLGYPNELNRVRLLPYLFAAAAAQQAMRGRLPLLGVGR